MNSTQDKKELQDIVVRFTLITSKFARSGKDTLADLLYYNFKKTRYDDTFFKVFCRYRFAKPLVEAFESIFGYSWDTDKLNPQVRTKLIKFSEACKTVDDRLWINKTVREVESDLTGELIECQNYKKAVLNYIFTDCRYNYEYDELHLLLSKIRAGWYGIKTEVKLVEIVTTETGTITDRDNIEDAITYESDIKIFNSKDNIAIYEADILDKLGYLLK